MRTLRLVTALTALTALIALVPASAGAALKKRVHVEREAGTELRNSPGDWVIGTANNNTTVWAQGPTVEGYRWVYIAGTYQGCAWISSASVTKGGRRTGNRCPEPPQRFPMSRFIGGNGKWWAKGGNKNLPHGSDGRFAVVRRDRRGC